MLRKTESSGKSKFFYFKTCQNAYSCFCTWYKKNKWKNKIIASRHTRMIRIEEALVVGNLTGIHRNNIIIVILCLSNNNIPFTDPRELEVLTYGNSLNSNT